MLDTGMVLLPLLLATDVPPEASATWARMAEVQRLQADFTQVRHSKLLASWSRCIAAEVWRRAAKMVFACLPGDGVEATQFLSGVD